MRGSWRPSLVARTGLMALVPAAGLLVAAGGASTAAALGSQTVVCGTSMCTTTFTTVGTGQSFDIPPGVTSLAVTLYGAVGGSGGPTGGSSSAGGDGAEVAADLSTLTGPGAGIGFDVGGAGLSENAGGGGVSGGGAGNDGGGGGGATDVIARGGATALVAGGGGGGGGAAVNLDSCLGNSTQETGAAGGNADTMGGSGPSFTSPNSGLVVGGGSGGPPGTVSGPGGEANGGTVTGAEVCINQQVFPGAVGNPGSGSTGGAGSAQGAGGGGGGYFGGGGGGAGESSNGGLAAGGGGGGGGGSSFTAGTGVSNAQPVNDTGNSGQVNGGNGEVVFSYTDPIATGTPAYSTTSGTALSVTAASGLLSATAGTAGPAGDALTALGPSGGQTRAGGSVTVHGDGSFGYTPPSGFTGTDSFGYTVSDGTDYATGTATVTVNQAPEFVADSPPLTATAGQPYGYDFTASGTPGPVYALAGGAPSWLSVNAGTGEVSGIPPKGTASFSYEVTATNTVSTAIAGPYDVTVSTAPGRTADLAAALACPAHLTEGHTATCTLKVTNHGPDWATRVSASASLPAQLAEVACTSGCTSSGNVFTWTRPGLAASRTATFRIQVQAVATGMAEVSAGTSSAITDPDPGNNFTTAAISVKR